ncbi:MAG: MBL fold metallo-hydrolase [Patescibacteria group bacterium]|nr:MBL fold metallo-hydrolase [Patescibacteria group bacterium]
MKLTFFGAAGEVTGSCTMLDTGKARILVDCGMFHGHEAGKKNHAKFLFDPKSLDAVLLTHAHLDHIGRLPRLMKEGFRGSVFTTDATRQLTKYMWEDAAKVQAEETEGSGDGPLYDSRDIAKTFKLLRGVTYGESLTLPGGIKARFRDAGHILGSAFIELNVKGAHFVFSGDIGNDDVPILRNTEPLKSADVVVMESTYGDRSHESSASRADLLKQAVTDVVKRGGVLMIPAFSLERTQEILYEMNGMVEGGALQPIPVFLDAPLATDILPVYRRFPEYYDNEAYVTMLAGDDFFRFPGLKVTRRGRESFGIDNVKPPKVIIAGSGMMGGGRIVRHMARYLPDKRNMLLVVGFQAEKTRGRRIVEGKKTIEIDGAKVAVNAEVRRIDAYSAHGDKDKMLRWLGTSKKEPNMVFLNHGERDSSEALAKLVRQENTGTESVVPVMGEEYEI